MKRVVRVEYSTNGLRDLVAAASWWREHRPASERAFDDEFIAAVEMLKLFPESARPAQMRAYTGARVKVLPTTGHLLVYRYAKSSRVLTVLAIRPARATEERP